MTQTPERTLQKQFTFHNHFFICMFFQLQLRYRTVLCSSLAKVHFSDRLAIFLSWRLEAARRWLSGAAEENPMSLRPKQPPATRERRKFSDNAAVQGSSAWIRKLASEIGAVDLAMVPPPNVVALDPDELKQDVNKLTHRLKKMESWLLNPRSKRMQVPLILLL